MTEEQFKQELELYVPRGKEWFIGSFRVEPRSMRHEGGVIVSQNCLVTYDKYTAPDAHYSATINLLSEEEREAVKSWFRELFIRTQIAEAIAKFKLETKG